MEKIKSMSPFEKLQMVLMILPTLTKNYIEQIVNFIEDENLAEPQNLNDTIEEERFAGGRSCPQCLVTLHTFVFV